MKTYKVGLIGFGFIGKVHAQAYHSIPFGYAKPPVQAQVTAVLRNDPDQDQELLQSLAIPLCTDNEQLFWEQDFDILDVCSPNSSHFSYCWKGIAKKIACYCEKPLTNQIEDARKLAEFSKESKIPPILHFATGFVRRLDWPKIFWPPDIWERSIIFKANSSTAPISTQTSHFLEIAGSCGGWRGAYRSGHPFPGPCPLPAGRL